MIYSVVFADHRTAFSNIASFSEHSALKNKAYENKAHFLLYVTHTKYFSKQ